MLIEFNNRSSHQRFSIKKVVLKNFVKVTGKHLCQCPFFQKVAGLRAYNFIKVETLTQAFFCKFCKNFKNTSFTKHLRTTPSVGWCFKNSLWSFQKEHLVKTVKRQEVYLGPCKHLQRAFLWKWSSVFNHELFSMKDSIIGILLGSQYTSWQSLKTTNNNK